MKFKEAIREVKHFIDKIVEYVAVYKPIYIKSKKESMKTNNRLVPSFSVPGTNFNNIQLFLNKTTENIVLNKTDKVDHVTRVKKRKKSAATARGK